MRGSSALLPSIMLACCVAACGSSPPPPTSVEITVVAAGDVNPDASGRASPITLRYYQLGATANFERADYFQIHDKEAALLGADLLDRQEIALTPGATQKIAFDAKAGTTAIGVIASYRDIDKAQWRADLPIPAGKKSTLKVQLDKLKVSMSQAN